MKAFIFVLGILFTILPQLAEACGCSSGCGLNLQLLKPAMRKLAEATQKEGVGPISCVRTQQCQDRLVACYNRCGQRGRAAKKSTHSDGLACDWSRRHGQQVNKIKAKLGLNGSVKRLVHKAQHGGGLHDYLGKGARDVASADGGYKEPRRMRNICVRWSMVPWCQAWIAKGNKPGKYPY